MSKENNKFPQMVSLVIASLIVIAFTWLGFFSPQPCDIDEQYLYCRLHPASFIQVIGVILFYLIVVFLTGTLGKWISFYNDANSSKWNYIFFGIGAASFLMMWFG
jgi:hypothetical protein